MNFKDVNNLQLARDYNECHRMLGERTLWMGELEDKIRRLLSKLSAQLGDGTSINEVNGELQEQKNLLIEHKERAYEAILMIYQIEAEMHRRTKGIANEQ